MAVTMFLTDLIRQVVFCCCSRRRYRRHKNSLRRLANKILLKEIKNIEVAINGVPERYREYTVSVLPLEVSNG
jgi:hypothetical protein